MTINPKKVPAILGKVWNPISKEEVMKAIEEQAGPQSPHASAHSGHDVREYDGGSETRFFCKTCGATWSEMRISDYEKEINDEEGGE